MTDGHALVSTNIHERRHVQDATAKATHVYPGAPGELLSRELLAWADFGYRLGWDTVIMQAVRQIHEEWDKRMGRTA